MSKKKSEKSINNKTDKKKLSDKKKQSKPKISTEELLAIEKDKNIRLFAEFDNFRKRTSKEKIDLYGTANKDLMTKLLPILDNFERCISANNYQDEDGPTLIYKQLKSELEKNGLAEIENPIGKVLDTDFHEAITSIAVKSKKEKGKVVDVIEKGYMLEDKILRYTKVVVGN